jgi:CheY-like chemotaxis protein
VKRILVVDDEPTIRILVAAILENDACSVTAVSSGERAFASAREERPDLILLDVGLPSMNGYEVMRCFRDIPDTATVPVVIMTGGEAEGGSGADGVIHKPFTPANLRTSLASWLS